MGAQDPERGPSWGAPTLRFTGKPWALAAACGHVGTLPRLMELLSSWCTWLGLGVGSGGIQEEVVPWYDSGQWGRGHALTGVATVGFGICGDWVT